MELKRNRNGWLESETHRQCTNCLEVFKKPEGKTMSICKKCNTARVKSQSALMKMYRRAKARAKEQDVEFSITPDDIEIPQTCPILGISLFCTTGKSGAFKNSPSLDKIDPTKGYIKGNVWVISQLANGMKSNATADELKCFAQWVYNNYGLLSTG